MSSQHCLRFWLGLYLIVLSVSQSSSDCDNVSDWMNHKYQMKGYHVLCITKTNDTTVNVKIWSQSYTIDHLHSFQFNLNDLNNDFANWRHIVESNIKDFKYTDSYVMSIPIQHRMQQWSMFTMQTKRINEYETFIEFINNMDTTNNILLIYEGGQFMYPGVSINYTRRITIKLTENEKNYMMLLNKECNSESGDTLQYSLRTLSLKPLVFSIDNFITEYEQESLLNVTYKLLHDSEVHNQDYSHWRTSSTAWINFEYNHYVNNMLSLRISKISKLPVEYQENTQVLEYLESQHYGLHLDFFLSTEERPNTEVYGNKNRLLTVLWYFNDVSDGGFTIFPMYNETWIKKIYNLLSIQHCLDIGGLLVKPEKGKVVLFYNLEPNGEITNYSLHGSCPVGKGQKKYAANKWIWNSKQHSHSINTAVPSEMIIANDVS